MRSGSASRFLPTILGIVTLAGVAALLLRDAFPAFFPAGSHDSLGAFSLAMIALAYLIYQLQLRPAPKEMVKAILLAAAFLFWAANQYWPNLPEAGLFNDIAIALFVLDVFLVMIGWPATNEAVFAEGDRMNGCSCKDACCCGAHGRRTKTSDMESAEPRRA